MKIYCLVENTQGESECACEHGLSLFVETEKHKILCDAGQTAAFLENSSKLQINPSEADILFLSHGHYDHSDGFEHFLPQKNAKMYIQKNALLPHYHGERYIGIKQNILNSFNTEVLNGDCRIDGELFIFTDFRGRRLFPKGNLELTAEIDGEKAPDDFSHEQCLVISENGKTVLISGCAHSGIVNILDRYKDIFGSDPDYVISGFHMMKNSEYNDKDIELIEETAKELKNRNTVFYTGHCTSQPAFDIMKKIMGDRLHAIHSGEKVIEI